MDIMTKWAKSSVFIQPLKTGKGNTYAITGHTGIQNLRRHSLYHDNDIILTLSGPTLGFQLLTG